MWLKLLNLLSLSLVLSSNAWASQVIDHAEKRHQQASISVHEQNRLVIEGRKIVSVVPSQAGVISVVKDEALGALYFTLANELHHGSVTLFVSDDAGVTYKLILAPRAIPGEEIIIRPPKGGKAGRRGHTTSYQRQVKDLLLGMIDGDKSGIVAVNKKVRLWKEVDLFFLSKHLSHDGLVGEKYRLANISPSQLTLTEQELYRPGVVAIAIESHVLEPHAQTHVYIVRERGAYE